MCMSSPSIPEAPKPPPLPQADVGASVRASRTKDRQRAAAAATQTNKRQGSSAAGLLSPATTASRPTLMGS